MRLATLERPKKLLDRIKLRLIGLVLGRTPPDPVKLILYRRDWLGGRFVALLQQVMRGASPWTIGERELFAAFTAKQLRCAY